MTFEYGKPNPRDEKVTNIDTTQKRDNDRKKNEVELLNQLFVLYTDSKTLYLSNAKKKKLLKKFLCDKLKEEVIIKNFYKTDNEIIQILKDVDKIQFTYVKNLFNQNYKQRQALKDLTGIEAPDKFTIEAEYKRSKPLVNWLEQLFVAKRDYQISELVICGRNEDNFEFVYNVDTFIRKFDINCPMDDNGKFNQSDVLEELLNNIKK